MSERNIVIVNGQRYDASTGLPIKTAPAAVHAPEAPKSTVNSGAIHKTTQHSDTLNRKYVAKPKAVLQNQKSAVQKAAFEQFQRRQARAQAQVEAKRVALAKKHGVKLQPLAYGDVISVHQQSATPAPKIVPHALAVKANQAIAASRPVEKRHLTAPEIKQRDITDAFRRLEEHEREERRKTTEKHQKSYRKNRLVSVVSMSTAVLLLVGYLTYLNMPAISVRIAAIQSGLSVSYPSYRPLGFNMKGLATASQGSAKIEFANTDGESYRITQQRSSWDSNAVLNNFVRGNWGSNYSISKERGLTIYTNGGNAVWVNGGIFYRVEGPQSIAEHVGKIAISL